MLAIVLVTYRSWELLTENISGLYDDVYGENSSVQDWEIVVVDNDCGEPEKSEEFQSRFPKVTVVTAHGDYGYGYGGNRGADASKNPYLVFGSADLTAPVAAFQALLQARLDNPDYAILTAPQQGLNGKLQRATASFTKLWNYFGWIRAIRKIVSNKSTFDPRNPPADLSEIVPVEWVSGSLVLISRDDFEAVGGWNEKFWLYCEDEDLCRRVHKAGQRVGYFPGPVFTHIHATSTRGTPQETALYKSETVLSKQVYLSLHEDNAQGRLLKKLIRLQSYLSFPVYSLLSLITGRSVNKLEIQRLIHKRLVAYYARVNRTGYEISEHAAAYDPPSKL